MRLIYNMYSLSVYKNYKNAVSDSDKSIANVSSGKKLNSAKDSPSKIYESDTLKINIKSRYAAKDNVQDTNSMIQTFDGALQELSNNVTRLKQLVTQASNGTLSSGDLSNIQKEINSVKSSINDLANTTSFNGIKLSISDNLSSSTAGIIDTTSSTIRSTIGVNAGEFVDIPIYHITTKGLNLSNINVTSTSTSNDYLGQINSALAQVNSIRSKYGSLGTSLDDSLNYYDTMNDTLESAQSDLEDADIATEMTNYSTSQVILKAGVSLMSQSNQLPMDCINLLISNL